MTDKQIIIDGVNVSGCKYYLFREQQPKGERCCGMGLVDCNNNDCLYKKYKRKEQECEELKRQLTILDDEDVVVEITVKQFEEYKNLKQTLTEIKEIAQYDVYTPHTDLCIKLNWVKKKIRECEVENDFK